MTTSEIAGASKFEVAGLHAWFGDKQVLHGIELDIPEGGITAIIGPSGCGKSTFIRCLNRMHELVLGARCEGDVRLDGEDIYHKEVDPVALRRRVGMVFQKQACRFETTSCRACALRTHSTRQRPTTL